MIIHALQIIAKQLEEFLKPLAESNDGKKVVLGNVAPLDKLQGEVPGGDADKILVTLINIREEKTLKNGPHFRRNDTTLKTEYFNPAVFLNMYVLISATQVDYTIALIYLSRIASFFQGKNVFTHLDPVSLTNAEVPLNDRMDAFKIILDLYSPNFEELNHIWGTLGGKQVPSLVYCARLVEVVPRKVDGTGGLVEEVVLNVHNANSVN